MESLGFEFSEVARLDVGTAVETGYFKLNGITYLAYDGSADATVKIKKQGYAVPTITLPFKARFFYIMNYQETIYVFYASAGGILAQKSTDLYQWTPVNGGAPVITGSADPNSVYHVMWNVAVTVDDQGTFHLLLECATNPQGGGNIAPENVGLKYLTAREENGTLSFDGSKTEGLDIRGGGNPEIKFIPGVGLISIHGQMDQPENIWYMAVSVLPTGASHWFEKKSYITLRSPTIHICDPTILELKDSLILGFSYNQNSSYELRINKTYNQLFNE